MAAGTAVTQQGLEVNDILEDHDLPERLIPDNVTGYTFDRDSGRFRVTLAGEVIERFGGFKVKYGTELSGCLRPGVISELKGVKAKVALWLPISDIERKGDRLGFSAGRIAKQLPLSEFL